MGAVLKRKPAYTLEEYFALEASSEVRYEFRDGEIVCMSGGSFRHAEIIGNMYSLLRTAGQKKEKCRVYPENLAVKTQEWPPYRYPDASVVCGPARIEKIGGATALVNPTIVVEVISPESEKVDKIQKRAAYLAIESLREYLIIEQDRPEVILSFRDETGSWKSETISGMEAHFFLPSLESRIEMSDVYENVDFADNPMEEASV
ncbi:MAG: Uma2 family endonuclease [Blastocatellia bacterium]|nr:Uma2 family endonuclease [Blastocatellia bacterium]